MISSSIRYKIIIEKGTAGTSGVSSPTLNYEEYISTYAGVFNRSSDVRYGENEELVYTTEFTIRYDSRTKLINNKYRIKYNDKYYRIIDVLEIEPKQTIRIVGQQFYGE